MPRLSQRPASRRLLALLTVALAAAACSSQPAAPSAAIGSGGATGTPQPSNGSGASVATSALGSAPASSSAPVSSSSASSSVGPAASPAPPGSAATGSGAPAGSAPTGSAAPTALPSSATSGASAATAIIGIPALGLSIRLPAGWVGLDSTVPGSILDTTSTRFPDLAESLAGLRAGTLGFVAYDATAIGATTPHATLATTGDAIPVASLLQALAKQTATQLATTQSITNVQSAAVTLPAGPAAELRYTLKPKGGGPDVGVDSWFIATAGHTFLLSFTVPANSADAMRPAFRVVAESLSGS